MHYYQFNIKCFAMATRHLTLEEEGVYRRLLDFYYDTELPIPEETQSVIRRLMLGSYVDTVGLILGEFFTLEADGWHNYRADIEINEYQKRQSTARSNGRKGGRPPKPKGLETQSVNLANPKETGLKANKEQVTSNHKQVTSNNEQEILCNQSNVDFIDCLTHLKHVTGRGFKVSPDLIARLKDYSVTDVKHVIEYKAREWMGKPEQKYLRPQTLFNRSKFEGYLIDAQQMVPTEKPPVIQDSKRANSFNNISNMFEPSEGMGYEQPKQLQD